MDLVNDHVKALEKLESNCGIVIYNLGTGNGYSVLDMVKAFSEVSGKTVDYEIVERRQGDIGVYYADPTKAKYGIKEMCEDTCNFQVKNSN